MKWEATRHINLKEGMTASTEGTCEVTLLENPDCHYFHS